MICIDFELIHVDLPTLYPSNNSSPTSTVTQYIILIQKL